MRVLVTGGSGFIGSHVVDNLINKGFEVRIYDGVAPTFRKDLEYYQGSILDATALGFAMHDIDAVFHLAAVADVKEVYANPHYAESINVRGTINVLEAARNAQIKRVVYGSTTWVYSEAASDSVDEKTPLHAPTHFYTATKLSGEYYCQSYSKLYGMEASILRYGIPYGPRARDGAVIPIFVKKALNGEPITIAGDGSQFRKFVYVEDLAEGNVLALKDVAKNKIFNLDGKEKITVKQIAETIKKIIGNVKIEYIPARGGDFAGKEVSSAAAKKDLGWEPKVSFEEGVNRYIDWYKKREEKRKNAQVLNF
ncbi:MAG: NAD-dependent epimerase/dehydratase family protein [Candidatus Omnitrophota bacterium]|jgi:UDP-glucose 4-epimerase